MLSKTFGLPSLVGFCLAALVAPAHAGIFEASADGFGGEVFPNLMGAMTLPQYAGPGTITSVFLALNGVEIGNQEEDYYYNTYEGLMADPIESVGFTVVGPLLKETSLEGSTTFLFWPINIPPCDSDLSCEGGFGFEDSDFSVSISGMASLTDLSAFAGNGNNNFLVVADPTANQIDDVVSGTLTQTITFTVPESSTWAMMLLGFAGLGAIGWRSRRIIV
jgi:hypothetical protein